MLSQEQFFVSLFQLVFSESPDAMSESHFLTPPQDRTRNFRSQSLKTQTHPFLFPPRPKRRTLSLPTCKPVIPPYIIIQGCQGNRECDSEEEQLDGESNKESMGKSFNDQHLISPCSINT